MATYKTLYRVFRPRVFDDVVGQGHITDILKRQVAENLATHAYLFCGPRGTGKTSTAKILANALNCLDPQQGNPCGKCEICTSFLEDSFVDIVEIDAASNNGVDSVRDIREKVSLLPANGRFKVYIIDEVHMLSIGAFNALLKTLEEPPSHAVFILATTERRKVPATILSRCQQYDFKRISDEDIITRLRLVAERTDTEYEPEALELIAQQSEGALRDALSIMDQCMAVSGKLTVDIVTETMGIAPVEALEQLADFILTEDSAGAVRILNQSLHEGISAHNLLRDIISVLSDRLAQQADDAEQRNTILRSVESLIDSQTNLRYTSVPEAVLLSAVVRATVITADVDMQDAELRIRKLEQRVERLQQTVASMQEAGRVTPARAVEEQPRMVQNTMQTESIAPKKRATQQDEKLASAPELTEETPQIAEQAADKIQQKSSAEEQAEEAASSAKQKPAVSPEKQLDLSKKLKRMEAIMMQKHQILYPSVRAIDRLEVQGSRLLLYAEAENAPLIEILADESNKKDVQAVTSDLFGQPMTLSFIYTEEETEQEDMQMGLAALFGEENLEIIE